jgi:hypothetical protein
MCRPPFGRIGDGLNAGVLKPFSLKMAFAFRKSAVFFPYATLNQ